MSLRKTTLLLILHLFVLGESAFSAALSWHANAEANISGYRIYYRTAFEDTPTVVDVGKSTSFELKGLQPETKYFVRLTAYSVHGLESSPSSEISFNTPPPTPKLRVLSEGIQLAIQGKPGGTLELYQSSDLKNWTWSRTILNATGEIDINISQTAAGGRQFFRLVSRGDTLAGWLALKGVSDPQSAYQGYSISNQFAYATGADLAGGPEKIQPTLGMIEQPWGSGTERFATFNYTIREGTVDVHPIIEMSHDLKLWTRAESSHATHSSVLNGNGTRTITLRETSPSSENPHGRRFYRLRFDAPPEISF